MKDPSLFVEDIDIQGMLYALTIRSPIARGSLVEIKAPKLPNSCQLITAQHIPGKNSLANFPVPILAEKTLSYIGQPVAIITCPERSKLEELSGEFDIVTEEEEPVFSENSSTEADIIVKREIVPAEADAFFKEGAKIISGNYTTGIQEHWYSEPHGAVAVLSNNTKHVKNTLPNPKHGSGGITIYTASQWPNHVKRSVARVLGWDSGMVEVQPMSLAEHLDGKIWYPSLIACHAALAAWKTGSPAKLMLIGEEDFMYSPKRNKSNIAISSSIGEKGEILASSISLKLDLGSEGVFEDEIIDSTCIGALGAYRRSSFKINGIGIRTNIPVQGPMAGFGLSQGFFAAERHISGIADSLGQDPAQWRKQNFLDKNLAMGIALKETVPLPALIDSVTAMSDYHRKWAAYELLRSRRREEEWKFTGDPLRGIGISTVFQGNGFLHNFEDGLGNCTAELTLEKDGSLEIKTSIIPSGTYETWLSLAHNILGVNPELVKLNYSGDLPDSGPATLSRKIGILAKLVERCCMIIKKQRFRDPLPITVKRSAKPGKAQGWAPDKKIDPEAFSRPGWGAAVVEIELDPVTMEPKIRGIWLVVDGGKIISLRRSHWTLRTGIIQAIGWASREQIFYKDGVIPNELYRGYDIISPSEIPPIYIDFIRNDTESPKGIGEIPFCAIPASYVQAVSQAMDHHFENIPLNARNIWEAGKMKKTEPL